MLLKLSSLEKFELTKKLCYIHAKKSKCFLCLENKDLKGYFWYSQITVVLEKGPKTYSLSLIHNRRNIEEHNDYCLLPIARMLLSTLVLKRTGYSKFPPPHIFEEKNQVGFYWFVYFHSFILFLGWLVVFVWGCYFLILWELFFF